jgi:hypothetical protein
MTSLRFDPNLMRGRDFRAELARLGLPRYIAAARVGVHPVTLSGMLWERMPLTARVRKALWELIEELTIESALAEELGPGDD